MPSLKNLKHELFSQDVVKGIEPKDSYKKLYSNNIKPNSLESSSNRLLNNVLIRDRISELLSSNGLDIRTLNNKLLELINKKKAIVINNNIQFVDDNSVQLESLKTAYKLHRLLGSNIETAQSSPTQINIFNDTESIKRLEDIAGRLEALRESTDDDIQDGEIISNGK